MRLVRLEPYKSDNYLPLYQLAPTSAVITSHCQVVTAISLLQELIHIDCSSCSGTWFSSIVASAQYPLYVVPLIYPDSIFGGSDTIIFNFQTKEDLDRL